MLRAVRGWRRVTALVRASVHVYGSWCPRVERMRSFRCGVGRSLHRRGKKFQPVRARRAFKKVVLLSIDCPHICSPRPFPHPSHLRLPSLMVRVRRLGSSRTKSDRRMGIHGA